MLDLRGVGVDLDVHVVDGVGVVHPSRSTGRPLESVIASLMLRTLAAFVAVNVLCTPRGCFSAFRSIAVALPWLLTTLVEPRIRRLAYDESSRVCWVISSTSRSNRSMNSVNTTATSSLAAHQP